MKRYVGEHAGLKNPTYCLYERTGRHLPMR
jgi:hypothetical protein